MTTRVYVCALQVRWISDHDKLACVLAALGHDIRHPGLNQTFLKATSHHLCTLYQVRLLTAITGYIHALSG
jgi:hypothetical protein